MHKCRLCMLTLHRKIAISSVCYSIFWRKITFNWTIIEFVYFHCIFILEIIRVELWNLRIVIYSVFIAYHIWILFHVVLFSYIILLIQLRKKYDTVIWNFSVRLIDWSFFIIITLTEIGRSEKWHLIKIPNESERAFERPRRFQGVKYFAVGTPGFDGNNAQSMRKKINSNASRAFESSERKFRSQSILRCRKRRGATYIYRVRRWDN